MMATEIEKKQARAAVHSALGRKTIPRPKACEQCGGRHKYLPLEAHHDDYSKPFDVRWLCRSCHQRHHNALKAEQAAQTEAAA
jgi:RecJ-like exonuclease